MMELDGLVLRVSPPFELQSTVVTGEDCGKLEFLASMISFPTGLSSFGVTRRIYFKYYFLISYRGVAFISEGEDRAAGYRDMTPTRRFHLQVLL